MDGLIPDEALDRVRSATDIVELVSQHVTLKHTGANYLGLCPFHQEKTPSFTVSPAKQIFHCFGCGAGGDAVGFMMRQGNYSFPEAVRFLADRAGIELPERAEQTSHEDWEKLFAANEEAAKFYQERLWNSAEGKKALGYLKDRGMPDDSAKAFEIGYSPASWDGLTGHLKGLGLDSKIVEKAGLIVKKADGAGYYDRFRGRLMFPIRDIKDRVIGFGGRAMMKDEMPKYLNSPDTPLFKKGETLYGIGIAKETIRKRDFAIVVEGYMDAIACHRAGVANAVATLGTALTPGHLRLLSRFSKNVLLVFDADEAGLKAAQRSLDVFLSSTPKMSAKVALLPEGDDPDSLLIREGAEALKESLKGREKLLEFVIKREAVDVSDIDSKVKAVGTLTGILARVDDAVERSYYVKMAASELKVDESAVKEELEKKTARSGKTGVYHSSQGAGGAGLKGKNFASLDKIEAGLVQSALRDTDAALYAADNLGTDDFSDERLRKVAEVIFKMALAGEPVEVPKLLDALQDEDARRAVLELSVRETVSEDALAYAEGAVLMLLEARYKKIVEEVHVLLQRAGALGEPEAVKEISDFRMNMIKALSKKDFELLNTLQKELAEWQKKKSWTKSNS
ncbi:MAG: DNA primase [Nitrospirota bacterium]